MPSRNTPTSQQLAAFARKYIDFFENVYDPETESYYQFFDSNFSKECFALGFDMDCGETFSDKYGLEAWRSTEGLQMVIDQIDDISLIGSALFSKWRFYNHWADGHGDESVKPWFLLLFRRLLTLTESTN